MMKPTLYTILFIILTYCPDKSHCQYSKLALGSLGRQKEKKDIPSLLMLRETKMDTPFWKKKFKMFIFNL